MGKFTSNGTVRERDKERKTKKFHQSEIPYPSSIKKAKLINQLLR